MKEDIRDPETFAIIGAALEVHKILGNGFLEAVYGDAITIEMEQRKIPFRREIDVDITYKNIRLASKYKPDFICYGRIIVEIKAIADLGIIEIAQTLNYLNATGFEIGLLFNFGSKSLQQKRLIQLKTRALITPPQHFS